MNFILFLSLSAFIKSVPAPVFLIFDLAVVAGVWMLLRKEKRDEFGIRIVNHTAVFIIAWIAFSVIMGLFFTFDLLEASANEGLFSGFLHGLRIALLLIPCGVLFCCALVVWLLNKRAA